MGRHIERKYLIIIVIVIFFLQKYDRYFALMTGFMLKKTWCPRLPLKACVRYFYQIFIFSPNDSPSKTMKNAFYFIEKALFILKIFIFLCFVLPLFFCLTAIALEDD